MMDLGIDFGNIFNTVFVAASAALILFLLISTIAVAAKGKRKCNAFDVVLRLISSLALIASAAMLACFILSLLDGDFRLAVTAPDAQAGVDASAAFIIGDSVTELPLVDLFVILSTVIGFGIGAVTFMLSLTALIVDCLVANKKSDKQKQPKQKKTAKSPEQLKREAELERIRRIGETAVRKTSSVASAGGKSEAVERPAPAADPTETDGEPDFDWRVQPENKQSEFVGLKQTDDSFDSFDELEGDGPAAEEQPEPSENNYYDDAPAEQDDGADIADDMPRADESNVTDESDGSDYPYGADEQNADGANEQPSEYDRVQDSESFDIDEISDGDKYDDLSAWQFDAEPEQTGSSEPESYPEPAARQTSEYGAGGISGDEGEPQAAERFDEPTGDDYDIEPDRNIYNPGVRTITRPERGAVVRGKQTAAAKPAARSAAKPATRSTPKPATRSTPKPAAKPKQAASAGQPARSKPAAARPASPKAAAAKPAAPQHKSAPAKTKQPIKSEIPAEKKLPVTRRYVILDRHNAVNMFGEYLKERNKAEKDVLTSSINTIIIE